jgi:DDE superfamily endonuclease
VTVIEAVSAAGRTIPPVIIIQGKWQMDSWFRDRIHQNELVLLSESGFTTDQLTFQFLEQFIKHTKASPKEQPKLLLMDNHNSHITPEFILLANRNNVIPFSFPAHLTHCMQPCDVGIFQAMKHWHSKAIQCALETLDFEYTISSFLRDLPQVRTQTLKKMTIKHAFEKAGIWPIDRQKVLDKMSKYMKEATPEPPALPELQPPNTPRTTHEFRAKWSNLQPKLQSLQNQLSSPSQQQFDSIERGLQSLLDVSDITRVERDVLYTRITEVVRKKPTIRRKLGNGPLTASYAQGLIEIRDLKEKLKWDKKNARLQRIAKNKRKRELHESGVLHRRLERLRVKSLKQVDFDDIGAFHLTIPIPDPEKEALALEQEQENLVPEGLEAGDPEKWFVDTEGESLEPSKRWLQDNFVPLEEEDSSSDESFMSFESIIV